MGPTLLHPTEVGSVKLKSNDPFEDPLIEYEWANEDDIKRLIEGLRRG